MREWQQKGMLMMEEYMVGIIILVLLVASLFGIFNKKNKWIAREDFEIEKKKLKPNFSEKELNDFIMFLKNYKGGYVKRRAGQIIYQDFTGKEKGDLKGIFWNLVFPNPNIGVKKKEEFRNLLRNIGVTGVDNRPNYETRDSKLKNRKKGEEFIRKEIGNIGEKIIRDTLVQLQNRDYIVINGPILKFGDVCREFDHIVIGNNGVFCIETKAFGMTDGKSTEAMLFIDPGDKWIIRKNKTNRELESPTQQIINEKNHLQNIILESCLAEVHPILVLSNLELFIKNNIVLPYDVVRVDGLCDLIENEYNDGVTENDRMSILMSIDKCRQN